MLAQMNLALIILQTTTQTAPQTVTVQPAGGSAPHVTSGFELIMAGGWILIPILLLSVVALLVLVERFLLYRNSTVKESFMEYIRRYLQSGDVRGALAYTVSQDKPVARVLKTGLERIGRPITEIQEAVQLAGRNEVYLLEKRLTWLATIAGVEPMLGFIGTALGMIEVFQNVQAAQVMSPDIIAGGIWKALIATAMGLGISVITQLAYNYLVERVNTMINQIERFSNNFIDILQEPIQTVSVNG